MIVDFDDFTERDNRLDLLHKLKQSNPAFRCTLFAIPALGSADFWNLVVPEWCELAVHGWAHPNPRECEGWTKGAMQAVMHLKPERFVDGFKAPGWQISDGCYEALHEGGWWVADQPYNDSRRPTGLLTHRLGDGDHWHGHIPNVCGNGIEETFPLLLKRVHVATDFQFVSEAVCPW